MVIFAVMCILSGMCMMIRFHLAHLIDTYKIAVHFRKLVRKIKGEKAKSQLHRVEIEFSKPKEIKRVKTRHFN